MGTRIFDNMDNLSPAQLERDLQLLPAWRREKACAYRQPRDRALCAKAYILLCQLLEEEYNIGTLLEFSMESKGKPLLKGMSHIHFNMSHCPKGAICTVDDQPVGCDIESTDIALDSDLLERCCSLEEQAQITASEDPQTAFASLWTRKEAMLKLSGEGLSEDLPHLLNRAEAQNIEFLTTVNRTRGYVYTVCRYRQNQ